ncbi:DUF6869 domain-containing protein [Ruixingdingia sedimenti]|uniref:DUF6869 domain-containing protein n=1 Tax=Ruixingdingia sedimenti TaxID=3073604 RepID=A0ABU1FCI8_9RHOB|nr:hypothetical protein [Xinfangfangia sp. LG-4]MDR5654576.1 hypothetical protein [Xinfangfangia sp. LG-4]
MIPRALVAAALHVDPGALPEGDLPVARLAERWLGYLRATMEAEAPQDHPEFWTFSLLCDLADTAPDLCLDTVLAALALCGTAEEAALIAAGPLEDVIARNGPAVIDRIEAAAAASPRFRHALTGVWPQGSAGTPLWRRIEAARAGPTLDSGLPLPPA